jgi:Integrase core domain
VLVATSGVRRSDALGTRWVDLHLEAAEPHIRQVYVAYGKLHTFKEPKTQASRRTVPLPPRAVTALKAHFTRQAAEKLSAGLRQEFLTGRVFDDLPTAQHELDAWVASYNTQRPHSALDMATPADRFTPTETGPPADASALLRERPGDEWISRRITRNGVISVAWQEISCGKHRAGRRVDIHLQGPTMQIWDGRS